MVAFGNVEASEDGRCGVTQPKRPRGAWRRAAALVVAAAAVAPGPVYAAPAAAPAEPRTPTVVGVAAFDAAVPASGAPSDATANRALLVLMGFTQTETEPVVGSTLLLLQVEGANLDADPEQEKVVHLAVTDSTMPGYGHQTHFVAVADREAGQLRFVVHEVRLVAEYCCDMRAGGEVVVGHRPVHDAAFDDVVVSHATTSTESCSHTEDDSGCVGHEEEDTHDQVWTLARGRAELLVDWRHAVSHPPVGPDSKPLKRAQRLQTLYIPTDGDPVGGAN